MTRTGLPSRMGVAPARFAARMAAEDAGATGVCVIEPADFESYLLAQPLARFPGVGPKTAARLAELGARDVPGLRALGLERLEVLLSGHHANIEDWRKQRSLERTAELRPDLLEGNPPGSSSRDAEEEP